jgi:FkbM family methyltransferase
MHTEHNDRWNKDRGDELLITDYPLNENSNVIELGGYKGSWTKKIYNKFKPNMIVIEPISKFYDVMVNEIEHYIPDYKSKVHLEMAGISTEEKQIDLYISEDASSSYEPTSEKVTVDCHTLEYYMTKYNFDKVDLIQINIEGEEFYLFEQWIKSDILKKFRFIQIQFHRMGENYEERRKSIQEGLINLGFKNKWDYDFVWESWENTNW